MSYKQALKQLYLANRALGYNADDALYLARCNQELRIYYK